ncbi:hypothetical protein BDY21DRAFT_364100 [Lineolata rhizophorae]|uniref:CRIB domain-containing protein n=1 Tax=Lineolata rhizophorae TaxID=578093 RepID=A0A6A6NZN5_9PEZI|nr:hypothetical protein BDY21DRAFT_364100 [Lineolata rhizophorae]
MFRFSKSSTSPDSKKLSAAGRGRKRSSTDERAMLSDTPFSSKFSNRSELKEAHEKRSSPLIMHPLSRSRASTIASTTSSFASFSTVTNSEANSTRASSSDRSNDGYNAASERSWSKPRSFLTRRKSRRQNSKLGVVSTSESTEDGDDVDDGSRGRTTRMRRNTYDVNSIGVLKSQISAPFDFQHLTHTQHSQFPELDRTSQYELVAEFWAVRASQSARRDLRGIKAKDLYFENFSPEALAQQDGNDHASQDKRPSSEHSSPPSGPTTPNARRTHKGESTTVISEIQSEVLYLFMFRRPCLCKYA